MIELQDQQIMQQYFTDLLFQPVAEKLAEALKPKVDPLEQGIILLPLPTTKRATFEEEQVLKQPEETAQAMIDGIVLEDRVVANLPWPNYLWEDQRPPWAQQKFSCLLFDVCGFNFAVPLITLGQIQAIAADLAPVPGQAAWFMGIQNTPIGSVNIVNTAQYVMPERYKPASDYRPAYIISIDHCSWALAVDHVQQPISLEPGDVKWRANRERRVWLAGVVKQCMCVLLDIPTLANELVGRDKNSPDP